MAASPVEATSSADNTDTAPTSRRRRLSDTQEVEIARLYGETETSVPQIAQQFRIGEGTLYRVLTRQGVKLRGRTQTKSSATATPARQRRGRRRSTAAASTTAAATATPKTRGRRRGTTSGTSTTAAAATTTGAATRATPTRRRRTRRTAEQSAPTTTRRRAATRSTAASGSTSASASGQRFRIRFEGEITIEAANIREALRQADQRGAVEIISVSRA